MMRESTEYSAAFMQIIFSDLLRSFDEFRCQHTVLGAPDLPSRRRRVRLRMPQYVDDCQVNAVDLDHPVIEHQIQN